MTFPCMQAAVLGLLLPKLLLRAAAPLLLTTCSRYDSRSNSRALTNTCSLLPAGAALAGLMLPGAPEGALLKGLLGPPAAARPLLPKGLLLLAAGLLVDAPGCCSRCMLGKGLPAAPAAARGVAAAGCRHS